MDYIQVKIECTESEHEIIIAYLSELPFDTFEEDSSHCLAYMPAQNWDETAFKNALYAFKELNYSTTILPSKNWNEEYEKNFPDTLIKDRIHVRAPFHSPKDNIEYEIIIEPKMSFGTGNHSTTSQVMEAMLEYNFKGKTVLDLGSGTGILAILAEKMGAKKVHATDYDDWCIRNMQENKQVNNGNFEISKCDVTNLKETTEVIPQIQYDFILANLNRNLLLATFPNLTSYLNEKSIIITSGYYEADESAIAEAVEQKLNKTKKRSYTNKNWNVTTFE